MVINSNMYVSMCSCGCDMAVRLIRHEMYLISILAEGSEVWLS